MKLKKNDEVLITKGKDKGKKGKVDRVLAKENMVIVPGTNLYKRHKKARMQNEKSEIIEVIRPHHAGNVVLICPNCHKETRIGYKIEGKEKLRICKKCNKKI